MPFTVIPAFALVIKFSTNSNFVPRSVKLNTVKGVMPKIGDKLYAKKGNHILASDVVDAIPEMIKKYDKEIDWA